MQTREFLVHLFPDLDCAIHQAVTPAAYDPRMNSSTFSGAAAALEAAARLHRAGSLAAAEVLYRSVAPGSPQYASALNGLGICLLQGGRAADAALALERAAALAQGVDAAYSLANLANALQALGRLNDALAALRRALVLVPNNVDLLANCGNVLRELGRPGEAETLYARALDLQPTHLRALIGRGSARASDVAGTSAPAERLEAALADLDAAARFAPGEALAHYNRGVVLKKLKRLDEAAGALELAVSLQPGHADALYNLGLVRKEQARAEEALKLFDRALAARPDFVDVVVSRGHVLLDRREYADALACYERALALRPDEVGAMLTRSDALLALGRYREAARGFERALALAPDHPDAPVAHLGKAICHLTLGEFESGWEEFEWRWSDPKIHPAHRYGIEKLWTGVEDPTGRRVLLHSEQGLGDILQFCRYAPLLVERGARVAVEVPPMLVDLFESSFDGIVEVRSAADPQLAEFDLHTPFMTSALACATRLDTIPARIPYLKARTARVDAWRERLGQRPAGGPLRIGLAWSGNPKHGNDARRSIPLERFGELVATFEPPRVEWFSVQKEVRDPDRAALERLGLRHFGAHIEDFADTAALMTHLDLVISVDTSAAHLAGALGRPVWLLLPLVPDWRWMLERRDSPWYPSARLFRQDGAASWDRVLAEVARALKERVAQTETTSTD